MSNTKNTYTKKELGGYLVGMFGQNLIYNIVATGLYFYFQNVICLPAMALGWIFAIARVWDAVNDPMMGTIVDKTRTKWGKCKPYLIIFPAIIGVVTILTFINGNYATATSNTQKVLIVVWAGISYIVWGMTYTVCDIPLWGVTSLMTDDEDDRSKILGLARIIAGLGAVGVLVVQIAQVLQSVFEGQGMDTSKAAQKGFIISGVVFTVIATILFEFAGLSVKERVKQSEKHYSLAENFKIMFSNKPFRQILISGILRSPFQLLMIVAMPLVTYYFANGDIMNILSDDGINFGILINIAIIAVGVFVGQFVAMGITPVLIKKIEKKTLYNIYSIGGAVPFALIFVLFKLAHGDLTSSIVWVILVGIMFTLAGAAMGGVFVLQSVMIADCIDYEEYTNGVRTDGVFFSGQSFMTKLSAGLATIISAFVYQAVGYSGANIDTLNKALKQGASFITYDGGSGAGKYATAMFFLVSIPPAIGMAISSIPTIKYALLDKDHKKILEELKDRRLAQETSTESAEVADDTNAKVLEENADEMVEQINSIDK